MPHTVIIYYDVGALLVSFNIAICAAEQFLPSLDVRVCLINIDYHRVRHQSLSILYLIKVRALDKSCLTIFRLYSAQLAHKIQHSAAVRKFFPANFGTHLFKIT